MIDYTSQINALYQAIQFKPGSAIEIAQYNASLNSGALTLAGVQSLIEADPYTINYVNPVIREYQAAFGRVPDQAGLGYWAGIVAANPAALLTLGTIFANSAEFNARYGATATTVANVALVGALYANVLGRQGDQAGITYWAKSGLTAAQLLTAFAQSPEFIADVATPIVTYENLEAAGTPATTGSLFALAPPSAGGSFTLTTGADNPPLVANNNTISGTFNGAGATLTVGDTINGGTTTGNTLTLVDLTTSGAADPTTVGAVTISDIQTVIIQSGESINANTASSPAGFTGLTQLNVTESNNGANSTITAAATTNISVTDQSQRGGALSVEGGLNVSVATTETTSGPGSITVGDITAPKGTVTITATAAPTASGDFDMGAITVYGGTVVSITQTEAGSVNNTTFGGAVTVNGGAATTSVTVDQTAPVVKSATVAGVADGQVTITDANESGGAKAGVITTVVLDGLNGPNSIYDSALVNLTVNDSAANTGINIVEGAFATPATTLNLSLNNNAGLFVNDSGAKYTAVNMTVGALASTVTLFDFAAKTLTIAGTGGTLTFSSNATTLTSINASTDTGGVVFTDTWAGAVVTGGSGNDVVTLNAALTPASGGSINLGGGNNALLAGNSGSIASGVAIDGGTGGTNTIAATLVNAGNAASIKDFQIVDVSGYGSGNGGGTGSLDAFLLGAPVTGVAISTASTAQIATLQNLAAAVTVTDTYNTDNSLLTLTHAAGSATNSLAVNFAGTSTAATFETLNTLTSTGDTTIAISSGGASTQAGYYNAIDNLNETDNHLTTITITGAQAFKLFNVSTDGVQSTTTASSLTTIDGHAATGALTINAGGTIPLDNVTYTGLTIFGGTGGDTITNSAANGVITEGATASTLHNALTVWGSGATINDQASAGVDSIFLDGVNVSQTANLGSGGTAAASTSVFVNNATTTSTVLDTVNFGSGIATVTDTLTYQAAAGTNTAAINGNLLALTGALHAEILAFFAPIANPPGALGAATSVNSAQTFDQAVHYAESPTVNTVTWFQYANNTYIEDSGSTPTSTVGAEVVKITGLVDLSHATIGNGHLTFA